MSSFISTFNQFLAAFLLFLWSLWPLKPTFHPQITTPTSQLENLPPASTSAIIKISDKSVTSDMSVVTPSIPWGTTEKLGEHQYRTYVANDPQMGTPSEILTALNAYRRAHNVGEVKSDDGLCKLAQMRADQQEKAGNLDSHQGLISYMSDESHWRDLNVTAIGENASFGYVLSGTHLIEWIFDSDVEHRENQLNPSWNLACSGISGTTVDIIFGKR